MTFQTSCASERGDPTPQAMGTGQVCVRWWRSVTSGSESVFPLPLFVSVRSLPMNRRNLLAALILGAAVLGCAQNASAFCGLLGGHGGGCCEPACCEPACCEPACGCESTCCEPCGRPRCCLLGGLGGLFHRHNNCCCEESCCCEEPSCCAEEATCAAEPSCCAEEASCCCEESCCDPCSRKRCCLFGCLRGLFHRHNNCCEASCCCEPSCGCDAGCGCGG